MICFLNKDLTLKIRDIKKSKTLLKKELCFFYKNNTSPVAA